MINHPSVILVCGSREWTDQALIHRRLAYWREPDMAQVVIHGAAKGADTQAARIAKDLGYTVEPFPADWRKHGKPAGIIRNIAMLDRNPDLVIAFQVNGSRGTQHTISAARTRGYQVEVHAA